MLTLASCHGFNFFFPRIGLCMISLNIILQSCTQRMYSIMFTQLFGMCVFCRLVRSVFLGIVKSCPGGVFGACLVTTDKFLAITSCESNNSSNDNNMALFFFRAKFYGTCLASPSTKSAITSFENSNTNMARTGFCACFYRLPKPPRRTFGLMRIFPEKAERFRRGELEAYLQVRTCPGFRGEQPSSPPARVASYDCCCVRHLVSSLFSRNTVRKKFSFFLVTAFTFKLVW